MSSIFSWVTSFIFGPSDRAEDRGGGVEGRGSVDAKTEKREEEEQERACRQRPLDDQPDEVLARILSFVGPSAVPDAVSVRLVCKRLAWVANEWSAADVLVVRSLPYGEGRSGTEKLLAALRPRLARSSAISLPLKSGYGSVLDFLSLLVSIQRAVVDGGADDKEKEDEDEDENKETEKEKEKGAALVGQEREELDSDDEADERGTEGTSYEVSENVYGETVVVLLATAAAAAAAAGEGEGAATPATASTTSTATASTTTTTATATATADGAMASAQGPAPPASWARVTFRESGVAKNDGKRLEGALSAIARMPTVVAYRPPNELGVATMVTTRAWVEEEKGKEEEEEEMEEKEKKTAESKEKDDEGHEESVVTRGGVQVERRKSSSRGKEREKERRKERRRRRRRRAQSDDEDGGGDGSGNRKVGISSDLGFSIVVPLPSTALAGLVAPHLAHLQQLEEDTAAELAALDAAKMSAAAIHDATGRCWRQAVRAAHMRLRVLPGLCAELCGALEGGSLVLCDSGRVGEEEGEEDAEAEETASLRARILAAFGATNWPRSQAALALPELVFPRRWSVNATDFLVHDIANGSQLTYYLQTSRWLFVPQDIVCQALSCNRRGRTHARVH